jgi:putative iron-only hydrogenase system regulator
MTDKRIGTVSVIITRRESQAVGVNEILSEYGDIIIGRMGLPYTIKNIHIISLIVHGSTDVIGAMTGKLGVLPGVQVKSAMAKA